MAALTTYINNKYRSLCNYLQTDSKGTEITIYGVSCGMLLLACLKSRSNKLLQQYKTPAHIPSKLLAHGAPITGVVRDIQLRDQHTMLMLISQRAWLPFFGDRQRTLPVSLTGVKINGNGFSWLQNSLIGREATFVAMQQKLHDGTMRQLCLLHPWQDGKRYLLDISETLLKLRFAKMDAVDAKGNKYYKHLQRVEAITKLRESWIAWTAAHPFIWKTVNNLQVAVLPKQHLLPELLR